MYPPQSPPPSSSQTQTPRPSLLLPLLTFILLLTLLPPSTSSPLPKKSKLKEKCVKNLPKNLKAIEQQLCTLSLDLSPSECAKTLVKKYSGLFEDEDILEFCVSGEGKGPEGEGYECLKKLIKDKDLSPQSKLSICKTSSPTSQNYACTKSLKPPKTYSQKYKTLFCTSPHPSSIKCSNLFSKTWDEESVIKLCLNAVSDDNLECANHNDVKTHLSSDRKSKLCGVVGGEGPANCFKSCPSTLGTVACVELCENAESTGPSDCVRKIEGKIFRKLGDDNVIELCKNALNSGPGVCVNAGVGVEENSLVRLCKGGINSNAIECYKNSKGLSMKDDELKVELCVGASSNWPVKCFKESQNTMSENGKVELCKKAKSRLPAECAKAISLQFKVLEGTIQDRVVEEDVLVRVCNGVENSGVVRCFEGAGKGLGGGGLEELCGSVEDEKEGRRRGECSREGLEGGLEGGVVAKLCGGNGAEELVTAPVDCAMAAPYGFTGKDVLTLCEGAVSTGPSMCAKSVPNGFSNNQKAVLCSQASGTTPVNCLNALQNVRIEDAVNICSGATDLTVAYCVNSVTATGQTGDYINYCRNVESVSKSLELIEVDYVGEMLVPETEIFIKGRVKDQFGQVRQWDNSTWVSARIDVKGSNGATLSGGKVNVTKEGEVEFRKLNVDIEGNFTLKFYIDRGEEGGGMTGGEPAATLNLRIGQDPTEARLEGICHGLFDNFHCYAGDEHHQTNKLESLSTIPFPTSLQYLPCLDILDEAGFFVHMDDLGSLKIRSHVKIEMMATGAGLITKEMNFWERLGLPMGSSRASVKKAYFKKSLEWHPDRWVQHPHLRSKATAVFELVSEAYRGLSGCIDAEGGDPNSC
ncbi:hypothetical protein TL16_g00178 [Triparma laevis f. inornata]|uniref:J domain-containing protein n=1 Tax=Triparma laevis f. inornata TaxID=1714386 RepID=A0A9W6Z914_9STRA|nr:hypothetical protein TL16_g00178 [Triparma laevis f. inornata]